MRSESCSFIWHPNVVRWYFFTRQMYTHHKVDHEFPGGITPHISYMVCSVPRSGSSLLCELLCNTGVAGAPTEFFDPELMEQFRSRWNTETLDEYVAALLERKTSPNGVFGIKVHWAQLRPALGDADPSEVFPALRYVHISRADRLRQAVSWVRAYQTNQWASTHRAQAEPVFDRDAIDRYLAKLAREDGEWESHFERRGVVPHRVSYERLTQAPTEVMEGVLAFLGVSSPPDPAPEPLELERQADELTEEWVARYLREPA